ncbi:MAG: caspase family protein [Candidatus Thorarchaeota archaeon]
MNRKTRYLIFTVLVTCVLMIQNTTLVMAIAPPPPPVPDYTYRVYGYVYDDNTGLPVSGASVKLYTGSTYLEREVSGPNGYFYFYYRSSSAVGTFTVKISDSRYNPTERTKSALPNTNFGSFYLVNPIEKYAVLAFGSGLEGTDDDRDNWLAILPTLGFTSEKIFVFDAVYPSKTEIRAKVQEVAGLADWNDKILFAYTGHGDYINNSDTGFMSFHSGNYYYDYELKDDLAFAVSDVFIFLCSCHSGYFIDDFQGLSKYFVATATDMEGVTYGMGIVSTQEPVLHDVYQCGVRMQDSMWTYWFLDQLNQHPSEDLETVFDYAVEAYRQWYVSEKWVWQTVDVYFDEDLHHEVLVKEWIWDDTWTWNQGEEPLDWYWCWYEDPPGSQQYYMRDPSLNIEIGAPQFTGSSQFYL